MAVTFPSNNRPVGDGPRFDPRTASSDQLEAVRSQTYSRASAAGKRAQSAFVIWAAGVGVSVDDVNKIIAHSRMQFALKLPDVGGTDVLEAVQRAAVELGLSSVYDALRDPKEKYMLMMAAG